MTQATKTLRDYIADPVAARTAKIDSLIGALLEWKVELLNGSELHTSIAEHNAARHAISAFEDNDLDLVMGNIAVDLDVYHRFDVDEGRFIERAA